MRAAGAPGFKRLLDLHAVAVINAPHADIGEMEKAVSSPELLLLLLDKGGGRVLLLSSYYLIIKLFIFYYFVFES